MNVNVTVHELCVRACFDLFAYMGEDILYLYVFHIFISCRGRVNAYPADYGLLSKL